MPPKLATTLVYRYKVLGALHTHSPLYENMKTWMCSAVALVGTPRKPAFGRNNRSSRATIEHAYLDNSNGGTQASSSIR